MTTIFATASRRDGIPIFTRPYLQDRAWPGGGAVKTLLFPFNDCTVHVWPADPDNMEAMGKQLLELAKEMRHASVGPTSSPA